MVKRGTFGGKACLVVSGSSLVNHPFSSEWFVSQDGRYVTVHLHTLSGEGYVDVVIDKDDTPEKTAYWAQANKNLFKLGAAVRWELNSRLSDPENAIHGILGKN